MKGGFNKLMRNVAAKTKGNEFEQRLTKATFSVDTKEPKPKHVVYVLQCLKGQNH
jgi:molecular chaperone GrpE (heat shock protein)